MAASRKIDSANRQIRRVTNLGIVTNVLLAIIKVPAGFLAGSMALVADGLHSLSDIATDLAVLLGVHFGSKQPDRKHPYGHGRTETFAAVFIALVLAGIGGAMIYYAATDIAQGRTAKPAMPIVFAAAIISIITKELLYKVTKKIAVKTHSSALYANAWHHRSDALSSVAVLIGVVALRFGFIYGDQIAAIAVGLMIIFVGVRIIGNCIGELTEVAVDQDTIQQIERIIVSDDQISQWHKLRTRTVGREVFLDLHILVAPDLTVTAAHEICERLENTLHDKITRPVNITVHIEPDAPRFRK
ncbi:Magnetosome protein MamB [subsurface metagenome]